MADEVGPSVRPSTQLPLIDVVPATPVTPEIRVVGRKLEPTGAYDPVTGRTLWGSPTGRPKD
jgi:hypothetical protein